MRHPVFIVGMPRSGTSLLSAVLNSHSKLAISPETHYFTRCWNGSLRNFEDARKMVDCLFRQPGVGDMRLSEQERTDIRARVVGCREPSHREIFEALFEVYLARQGKHYWGEKTPDHWRHVLTIREVFPDAAFVSIVRDPRDVSLSLRTVPWNQQQTVIDHARQWNEYARASEEYAVTENLHFREIRYEDLITDFESVIQQVLDFLECSYEPQVTEFYQVGTQNVDPSREPWKAKTARPIDPTNRERWVQEMSGTERKIIQELCGSMMKVKGYRTEQLSWTSARIGRLVWLLGQTVWGYIYRRYTRPWYLRPEATERSAE